ncbi:MAG: hypothetical protein K0Q87_63 [Neobacillus sp.]|jgi:hypothetical protein|nr:hypothetical protein [Neobacillus sp.]
MDKTLEVIEKLKDYPDRELIFMYPEEGSDHYYTLGQPSKVLVDEYVTIDGTVYLKGDEDVAETLADGIADELFSYENFPLSEEQNKEVDEKLEKVIAELDWKKAIVVYIQPK